MCVRSRNNCESPGTSLYGFTTPDPSSFLGGLASNSAADSFAFSMPSIIHRGLSHAAALTSHQSGVSDHLGYSDGRRTVQSVVLAPTAVHDPSACLVHFKSDRGGSLTSDPD